MDLVDSSILKYKNITIRNIKYKNMEYKWTWWTSIFWNAIFQNIENIRNIEHIKYQNIKYIKYGIWIDQVDFHILKCICPEYIQCVDMGNWLYAGVVTQLAYDAPSLPPSSARASHHGCAGEHQPSAAAPGAAPSAITAAPGGAPAITAAPRGRLIYLWNMRGCTDGFPYPEVGCI